MAARTVTVTLSAVYSKRRGTPRLFRCDDCKLLTDDPDGHAEWHATVTFTRTAKASSVHGYGKKPGGVDTVTVIVTTV